MGDNVTHFVIHSGAQGQHLGLSFLRRRQLLCDLKRGIRKSMSSSQGIRPNRIETPESLQRPTIWTVNPIRKSTSVTVYAYHQQLLIIIPRIIDTLSNGKRILLFYNDFIYQSFSSSRLYNILVIPINLYSQFVS